MGLEVCCRLLAAHGGGGRRPPPLRPPKNGRCGPGGAARRQSGAILHRSVANEATIFGLCVLCVDGGGRQAWEERWDAADRAEHGEPLGDAAEEYVPSRRASLCTK